MAHATTGSRVALASVVRAQCATIWSVWPRAARGEEQAIHHLRTTSRRLRETLPVVIAAAPASGAARMRRDARRLTRAPGVVRELDVTLGVLGDGVGGQAWTGPELERVRRTLTADRAHECRDMQARLESLDRNGWRDRSNAVIATLADARPAVGLESLIAKRLQHRAAGVRRALTEAGTLYAPEALHRVRIGTKKLRYCLELARDVAGANVAGLLESLAGMQDRLGRIHDLQVLEQHMRSMTWPAARRGSARGRVAMEAALERECREQHAAYLAHRAELQAIVLEAGRILPRGPAVLRRPMRMTIKVMGRPSRAAKSAVGVR